MRPAGGLPGWSPADLAVPESVGGLAFFVARLPCLSLPFCPHPPAPLPGGKGEIQGYFMQGAPPLASPGAESGRHRSRVANHAPAGGLPFFSPAYPASAGAEPGGTCRVRRIRQLFQKRARAVALSIKIREKFWGVWGTLSRVPQRFSLPPSRVSIF